MPATEPIPLDDLSLTPPHSVCGLRLGCLPDVGSVATSGTAEEEAIAHGRPAVVVPAHDTGRCPAGRIKSWNRAPVGILHPGVPIDLQAAQSHKRRRNAGAMVVGVVRRFIERLQVM